MLCEYWSALRLPRGDLLAFEVIGLAALYGAVGTWMISYAA